MKKDNITTIDPYTLEAIKTYPLESFSDVKQKVDAAIEAQKTWRKVPIEERLGLVKKAAQYFEINKDVIAKDLTKSIGRPLKHSYNEISGFFERANYLCEVAPKALAPDVLPKEGFTREIQHEPLGVIFTISAWNYPLLITINSVIPALIAGNVVILKHSSITPEVGLHFEKAFSKLGDFSNLLQSVIIDHQTTGQTIEESAINHVVFTGSVNGGRQILQHTAKKFIQPQLELGGKDAAYICSDADLNNAAETIVDGGMYNSGQSCCGVERVYADAEIYDELVKKCSELFKGYQLGDPMDEETNLGPLAQAHAAEFMTKQIDEAVKLGAKVISGGKKQEINNSVFFQPTLLVDTNHEMSVMKEENFGPILPIMKVSGLDEAINLVNDSDYGLTSSIFTNDKNKVEKFSDDIETGTVFMNRCDYLDPALPWTGVKNSGCGSSLSHYGFYGVTRRKSIHFKTKI